MSVKALIVMSKSFVNAVYPATIQDEIGQIVEFVAPPLTAKEVMENLAVLQDVEVLFSGWGGLQFDDQLLAAAPNLQAIFHAAGSIKPIVTPTFWEKDIQISSAYVANAIPVAEYALAQILFSLKNGWQFVMQVKEGKKFPPKPYEELAGGYGSTVGLISFSTVGRKVYEYLQPFNLKILVYDPFMSEEEAHKAGIVLCSLEGIFKQADVVSLHTPLLPETVGMITGQHFASMKKGASFINTARGAIIREEELIDVLEGRSDLTAILDVTNPEPPQPNSPLFTLPNVVLTPHIAGSEGAECGRMGAFMLEEYQRYQEGKTLKWGITKEKFDTMA